MIIISIVRKIYEGIYIEKEMTRILGLVNKNEIVIYDELCILIFINFNYSMTARLEKFAFKLY